MSTLNVDKVDPSTGTALELGSSGDTVNLGSGVTAGTGFYNDDQVQSNIAMLGFNVMISVYGRLMGKESIFGGFLSNVQSSVLVFRFSHMIPPYELIAST